MAWSQDGWGNGVAATSHFGLPVAVIARKTETGPTFTDTFSNRFSVSAFVNTAVFMQNGISESLNDGSGRYFLVLQGGVTNAENSTVPVYILGTNTLNNWTAFTTSTVSWVTG